MTKKEFDHGHDDCNTASNTTFETVLEERMSRREAMKLGAGLVGTLFLGSFAAEASEDLPSRVASAALLGFGAVAKHTEDILTVPQGYTARILYALGDPIAEGIGAYANDGSDTSESFLFRSGDHHDGMSYMGLSLDGTRREEGNATRGLLCVNHENITQMFLHTPQEVRSLSVTNRSPSQIDKEVNAHGVSIIEIRDTGSGFVHSTASRYNRRITPTTPMRLCGPASGSSMMATRYSPEGKATRGTLNNCSNGSTPWGTYLTCEENWAGCFKKSAPGFMPQELSAHKRYGITSEHGKYGWAECSRRDDLYERWHVAKTAESGKEDYRNIANTFGWVVEIDPYDPGCTPRKRTAMGRFAHEGAVGGIVTPGKPIVYYMGDDSRGEYIYKYVSARKWDPSDAQGGLEAGDRYLDEGKLYAAVFNADGTGEWRELSLSNEAVAGYAPYRFADKADVSIHSRLAADAAGATKMDRPEWTGVHPLTAEVYVTLTNNIDRGKAGKYGLDPANPRYYEDASGKKGNLNGHIIRIREEGSEASATAFEWDVYLFGAPSDSGTVNISGLATENDFSGPDGLFFSQASKGLMWIQTDDSAYTRTSNCMMLAALPGAYGDGGNLRVTSRAVPYGGGDENLATHVGKKASAANLKRFLVGPRGCEITGITETPDGRTLFVNIQHPGENTEEGEISDPSAYESHWPAGDTLSRPRSATVVITKDDGGIIGT